MLQDTFLNKIKNLQFLIHSFSFVLFLLNSSCVTSIQSKIKEEVGGFCKRGCKTGAQNEDLYIKQLRHSCFGAFKDRLASGWHNRGMNNSGFSIQKEVGKAI